MLLSMYYEDAAGLINACSILSVASLGVGVIVGIGAFLARR